MNEPTYRVSRLGPAFDLTSFDCGHDAYNRWLSEYAAGAVEAGSCVVYLLLEAPSEQESVRVVGYYAICPTMVVRSDLPRPFQRGALRHVPAWLLAKLAVDVSLRGNRDQLWGAQLLREALETILHVVDRGGGQLIVVDADNDKLVDRYGRHGFKATGGSDLRMYLKVTTARSYLLPE